MATYQPPSDNLAIFDPSVFDTSDKTLTYDEATHLFLKYPVAQGAETISQLTAVDIATDDLQVFSINANTITSNDLIAVDTTTEDATINNILECNTINAKLSNDILSIGGTSVAGNIFLGTNSSRTSTLNIGSGTSPSGAVNINTGASSTSTTNIGTGTGGTGKTINIGAISAGVCATNVGGSNIIIGGSNCGSFQIRNLASTGAIALGHTLTGGSVLIGSTDATNITTAFNLGVGSNQSGVINIGTGTSNSSTINLATGGSSTSIVNIGRGNVIQINNTAPAITLGRPLGLSGIAPNFQTHLGYTPTSVSNTFITAITAPANRHTIATPPLTLGVGMFSITYWTQLTIGTALTDFTYNHGIMTTLPNTGDSPTSSSVIAFNTIGNGCDYVSPSLILASSTGFTTYPLNGIILNNYTGTYNTLYAIFNFKFTLGSISSGGIFMRATRVG